MVLAKGDFITQTPSTIHFFYYFFFFLMYLLFCPLPWLLRCVCINNIIKLKPSPGLQKHSICPTDPVSPDWLGGVLQSKDSISER